MNKRVRKTNEFGSSFSGLNSAILKAKVICGLLSFAESCQKSWKPEQPPDFGTICPRVLQGKVAEVQQYTDVI